jgi:undecaprenyl-diphosphatase
VAFGVLAALVRAGRTDRLDRALTRAVQRRQPAWLARLSAAVAWPGYPPQSRLLPPLVMATLWLRGWRLEAVCTLLGWGTGALSTLVKDLADRPRPPEVGLPAAPAALRGSSFPAGHVMTYLGVYGFLAYCLHGRGRRVAAAALAGLVVLVGPSRVQQGHHWPSDVLGAYLLGGSSLLGVIGLYRRLRHPTPGSGRSSG